MKNCISCDRPVNLRRLRCEVCGTRNWRTPHIAVIFLFLLALAGGVLTLIDNLAAEANYPEASKLNNTSKSDPDHLKNRQRVRGTSIGKPDFK